MQCAVYDTDLTLMSAPNKKNILKYIHVFSGEIFLKKKGIIKLPKSN